MLYHNHRFPFILMNLFRNKFTLFKKNLIIIIITGPGFFVVYLMPINFTFYKLLNNIIKKIVFLFTSLPKLKVAPLDLRLLVSKVDESS